MVENRPIQTGHRLRVSIGMRRARMPGYWIGKTLPISRVKRWGGRTCVSIVCGEYTRGALVARRLLAYGARILARKSCGVRASIQAEIRIVLLASRAGL